MTDFSSPEFIESFLEEADQHLQNITARLLKIEHELSSSISPESLRADLNEIFRSFHTLKGLAGMVGLTQAAELSHSLESILRDIQKDHTALTPSALECLISGSKTLAQIVETLRDPSIPMPDIQPHLQSIQNLLPGRERKEVLETEPTSVLGHKAETASQPSSDALEPMLAELPTEVRALLQKEHTALKKALQDGLHLSLAIFTPSSERAQQGINVNHVRSQLTALGNLLIAAPLIDQQGIRFAFVLASEKPVDQMTFPWLNWLPLGSAVLTLEASPSQSVQAPEELPADTTERMLRPSVSSMRVDINRMDELMYLIGELVITRSRLSDILPSLAGASPDALERLKETSERMERQLRDLRQAMMRVRLVPLKEIFGRMPLAVRDLARTSGKQVNLIMEGENTEIDKALVERLLDPLLHLVRNAITHGIEQPQERRAAGKPESGTILLRGYPEADRVVIEISDDGRGVDLKAVAEKAHSLGWLTDRTEIDADQALEIICRPGFSTRGDADVGAGRGVGMNVVAETVSAIGGSLQLKTEAGTGTTFILRLPLTLAIIDALIVSCSGERFAVPQGMVNEVFELEETKIAHLAAGGEIIPYRHSSLPILRLARLFHLPEPTQTSRPLGLLIGEGTQQFALVVDRVLGLREAVVRTISDPLIAQPGVGGATELGDGSVILILNIPGLVKSHLTA